MLKGQLTCAARHTDPPGSKCLFIVEARKLETQQPQSLRVMYRESQHYLALIRFPTLWGLLYRILSKIVTYIATILNPKPLNVLGEHRRSGGT